MPNELTAEQKEALDQWHKDAEQQFYQALRVPMRVFGSTLIICLLALGMMLPAILDIAHRTHP